RFLPSENVVGRHTPGSAGVSALAHQKFQEERRQIEAPVLLSVREDRAEHAASAGAAEEMFLVRGLVVGISGRKHHAFEAELHHVVEKGAYGFGIGSVEERGVGGDAEAATESFFDGIEGDIVTAFAADGEVMLFALAVEVNTEGQIFTWLEEM